MFIDLEREKINWHKSIQVKSFARMESVCVFSFGPNGFKVKKGNECSLLYARIVVLGTKRVDFTLLFSRVRQRNVLKYVRHDSFSFLANNTLVLWCCRFVASRACLRTFAPIATAHPYSARKFTCHVMHRARARSTKMNNDRADGHCYSFAWI